jgi:hypothetical protein
MKTITGQYSYPFGSLVPAFVMYVPGTSAFAAEITTITVPVIASQTRDYAKELLNRVRYLQDTYVTPYEPGGILPSTQAFKDAESFILKLPLTRTGMPAINVASDGEVNFSWSGPNTHIDLGFFGNGTYSYYGRGAGTEVTGENVAAKSDVPNDLLRIAANSV